MYFAVALRVGVAGRNGPAEMGGEGRSATADREEPSSLRCVRLRGLRVLPLVALLLTMEGILLPDDK